MKELSCLPKSYLADPLYRQYHDKEWCRPVHDDAKLYELFLLEFFQAGLSWSCILHKREAFREAFNHFDVEKIASYGDDDVKRLMDNKSIIRSRPKILAAIGNAKIVLSLISQYGSFDAYLWSFTSGKTLLIPCSATRCKESDLMALDMKRRGIKFAGSVTLFSFMQAYGQINSHDPLCPVYTLLMEVSSCPKQR